MTLHVSIATEVQDKQDWSVRTKGWLLWEDTVQRKRRDRARTVNGKAPGSWFHGCLHLSEPVRLHGRPVENAIYD